MRFDVISLFPEMFAGFSQLGIVGRAVTASKLRLVFHQLRDQGAGKHRQVDDTPYGGGAGMVMRVDVLVAALEACEAQASPEPQAGQQRAKRILLSPQGRLFDQATAYQLAKQEAVTLICGRYEGVDERLRSYVDDELSMGDYVLSGGEVAAMAVIDACARLLPGVLGNPASLAEESHSPTGVGLLEYPHYTRPATFRGQLVPEVLQGGNHQAIASWRREQAKRRTIDRRPDLLAPADRQQHRQDEEP